MAKKILITGVSGFLGSNLAAHFDRHGWDVWGSYLGHEPKLPKVTARHLDICLPDKVAALLDEAKPDAVIHSAAMAAPDACAADVPATRQINVQGPKIIAAACAERGIKLAFSSTDLVFSGARAFQLEEDPLSPLGVYGKSKQDAEAEVLAQTKAKPLVARLALLYGWGRGAAKGRNFTELWLRSLLTGGKVAAFSDQFRTPTYVEDVSEALRLSLEKGLEGVLHVAGSERCSRHAMAVGLAKEFSLPVEGVVASSANDVVQRDPRPLEVTLSIERLKRETGFTPRGLADGIKAMHEELTQERI